MNSGIIAERYTKAFFELIQSRGSMDDVISQIRVLNFTMGYSAGFKAAVTDEVGYSLKERLNLLSAAVDPRPIHPDIVRFYRLLDHNRRLYLLKFIFLDCLKKYMDIRGIIGVRLISAYDDPSLVPFLTDLIKKRLGLKAFMEVSTDPSLIGGFICETWEGILDSSVKSQLEAVKNELSKINKRVV